MIGHIRRQRSPDPQVHLSGGYVPAPSEVSPSVERAGAIVTDIEILRLHYALTLMGAALLGPLRRGPAVDPQLYVRAQ
jgi:hypothetical protein